MKIRFIVVAAFLALAVLASCNDSGVTTLFGVKCVDDSDCQSGEICVLNECVNKNDLPPDWDFGNDGDKDGLADGDGGPDGDFWPDGDDDEHGDNQCTSMGGYCATSCMIGYVAAESLFGCIDSICCLSFTCVEEGQIGSDNECCHGLSLIANSRPEDPFNSASGCLGEGDGTVGICTNCGNGVCGLGENFCNCSDDCPRPPLACQTPQDCGDATCYDDGATCTQYLPRCVNNTCRGWDSTVPNAFCMGGICIARECEPGDKSDYLCPDGTKVTGCTCTSAGSWDCVENPQKQCPPEPICREGQHIYYTCPDGSKVPYCMCLSESCPPTCQFHGTRSEGWYGCDDGLLAYDQCDGCNAICKVGASGEGHYSSCSDQLLLAGSCELKWSCKEDPKAACHIEPTCDEKGGICFEGKTCPNGFEDMLEVAECESNAICCKLVAPNECVIAGGYCSNTVACSTGFTPIDDFGDCPRKQPICCYPGELECSGSADCPAKTCSNFDNSACKEISYTCQSGLCQPKIVPYLNAYCGQDNRCHEYEGPSCLDAGGSCFAVYGGKICPDGWVSASGVNYQCPTEAAPQCCFPNPVDTCTTTGGICTDASTGCPLPMKPNPDAICPDGDLCCVSSDFCDENSDCGTNTCYDDAGNGCVQEMPMCYDGACNLLTMIGGQGTSCNTSTGICNTELKCQVDEDCEGMCSTDVMEDCLELLPYCADGQCAYTPNTVPNAICSNNRCVPVEPPRYCQDAGGTCFNGGQCPNDWSPSSGVNYQCKGSNQLCCFPNQTTECAKSGGTCTWGSCPSGTVNNSNLSCSYYEQSCCVPWMQECRLDMECGQPTCTQTSDNSCYETTPRCREGICTSSSQYVPNAYCEGSSCAPITSDLCTDAGGVCRSPYQGCDPGTVPNPSFTCYGNTVCCLSGSTECRIDSDCGTTSCYADDTSYGCTQVIPDCVAGSCRSSVESFPMGYVCNGTRCVYQGTTCENQGGSCFGFDPGNPGCPDGWIDGSGECGDGAICCVQKNDCTPGEYREFYCSDGTYVTCTCDRSGHWPCDASDCPSGVKCEDMGGYCGGWDMGCQPGYSMDERYLCGYGICCMPGSTECNNDMDCGVGQCFMQDAKTCVEEYPKCSGGQCMWSSGTVYGGFCNPESGRCDGQPECSPGQVQGYYCGDGSYVDWCYCNETGTWSCYADDPEQLCKQSLSCTDVNGYCPPISGLACSAGFVQSNRTCTSTCIGGNCTCCEPDNSIPCQQYGGYCNAQFGGCKDGYTDNGDPLGCPTVGGFLQMECCMPMWVK